MEKIIDSLKHIKDIETKMNEHEKEVKFFFKNCSRVSENLAEFKKIKKIIDDQIKFITRNKEKNDKLVRDNIRLKNNIKELKREAEKEELKKLNIEVKTYNIFNEHTDSEDECLSQCDNCGNLVEWKKNEFYCKMCNNDYCVTCWDNMYSNLKMDVAYEQYCGDCVKKNKELVYQQIANDRQNL